MPVTDETAVLHSFVLRVQLICKELQLLQQTLGQYEQADRPGLRPTSRPGDLRSLPGAGPVLAPRLLASMGSQRERFEAGGQLQRYSGVAPVTKQSGGILLRSSALLLSEVPQAELPRVRQGKHPVEPLGRGLLPAAAPQRFFPPHGRAGAGLQMAAHHLALLAEPHEPTRRKSTKRPYANSGSPLVALLRPHRIGQNLPSKTL